VGGIIVKLPPLTMEDVTDIGLYHRSKKVHNVSYGGTNIVMEIHLVCQNGMV